MSNVIEVTIGENINLSRTPMIPMDIPLQLRFQFLIRFAIPITIIKARGQSSVMCSLDLETDYFLHEHSGSRVGKSFRAKNIVYVQAM